MSSNPIPRKALRKAPDASIHPAAPVAVTAIAPVTTSPVPVTRPVTELRPVLGIGGSTSDVLRKAPKPAKPTKGAKGGKDSKAGKSRKSRKSQGKSGAKKDVEIAGLSKSELRRRERRVDLRVHVPKEVREELRRNAKARGTSVDDVVTTVLEGWLGG